MSLVRSCLLKVMLCTAVTAISVLSAERPKPAAQRATSSNAYSIQNDIAFVSVWGSRPSAESLQGFRYAVLYNARGEVVKKIEMGRDSVYSLDKMIQENRTRGPLMIRMYRKK